MLEEKRLTIAPGSHLSSIKMLKIGLFWLIALFIFSLSLVYFEPEMTVWGVLLFVSTAFFMLPEFLKYIAFRWDKKQYAVTVTSSGVSSFDPQYQQLSLAWSEIRAIENDSYLQTLNLYGPSESPPLRLSYHLEGLERLVPLLAEKLLPKSVPAPLPVSFTPQLHFLHPFWLHILPPLVAPLLLPGYFLFQSAARWGLFQPAAKWVIGGVLVVYLLIFPILFLLGIRRLDIQKTGLCIYQGLPELFTKRIFPFSDIVAVDLVAHRGEKGGVSSLDVEVKHRSGLSLSVLPDESNVFAVYRALQTGWEQSGKASANTTAKEPS